MDRRIGLLFGLFAVLLVVAGARALQLGTLSNPKLAAASDTQQSATDRLPAQRGAITDRTGNVVFAVSSPAYDVSATPYLIKDPAKAAQLIAAGLGLTEADVLKKLVGPRTGPGSGFVYLAKQIPAAKGQALQKALKKANVDGVNFDPTMRRDYPQNWAATQVVGITGVAGKGPGIKGLFGLEYSENKALRGQDGVREITRDNHGQPVDVQDEKQTEPGQSVKLTLDAAIQRETETVLAGVGKQYAPKSATAIVMDPKTSALLAIANWPRVNANDISGAPADALQDRATNLTYEPGSTFKAFTVAGALQDGKVTPDTSFNLAPTIQVADRTIGEAEDRGWETMTTAQILAQSSNVGAITIGSRLGKDRFGAWVKRFGFGEPTGVDLPGEQQGLVIPPAKYSGSSMGNLPIGQGLLVTPLQMINAYAAIADGGIVHRPHVVASVGGRPVPQPAGHRVISEHTATELRTMLEGVLAAGGTASEVSVPGYTLAGKTGTASKIDPKTKAYSHTKYVASFMGFAPAADPQLLVAVVVDEPQGDIYGGSVAAPAFGKIANFALPYLQIPATG